MFFGSATDLGTSLWFIAIGMLVLAAVAGATVARALTDGEKLQRETEGVV